MVRRRNLKCGLLLSFTLVSVGLFFAFREKSSIDIADSQDLHRVTQKLLSVADPTGPHLQGDNVNYDDSTTKLMPPLTRKRHVLLIVAHGRSGSTFLADIFDKHPRVFYVFEPLHGIRGLQAKNYDEFATNFLVHIFQCDFSVGNSTWNIGHFYRFKSRALSSPPFCKYKQEDPRWNRYYCLPVKQKDLEQSCREHDTTVYKLLLERIPGKSIEKLFEVCEVVGIRCKVIHLIRDIRPLVMSSQKVVFFKEFDWLEMPSMRQFVYSRCEVTERNLNLVKEFGPSLRSRVTLVRFEDLAVEPLKVLEYLYAFAGLEILESITNWIIKITQPSLKDLKAEERNPVSVVRNSFEVLNKWRVVADPCYVHVIERYCRDVMKLMGYIATEGSVEMLRNLEISLFTDIYQTQNWVNK